MASLSGERQAMFAVIVVHTFALSCNQERYHEPYFV